MPKKMASSERRRYSVKTTSISVRVTVKQAASRGHVGILMLYDTLHIDQVDEHRNEACENYDKCLEFACGKRWRSFSCRFCDGTITLK